MKLGLPPLLAIYVECEGPVTVRTFVDTLWDELRLGLDVEMRPDLLDAIEVAVDRWQAGLRARRDAA